MTSRKRHSEADVTHLVRMFSRRFALVLVLSAGCGRASSEADTAAVAAGLQTAALTKAAVHHPALTADEAANRGERLVSVLLGRSLGAEESLGTFRSKVSRAPSADAAVDGLSHVKLHYREGGYLTVTNAEVAHDRDPGTSDIGEAGARARFKEVFASLVDAGLVQGAGYDPQNATMGRVRAGAAPLGQVAVEFTKEYRFYLKQKLGSVEVTEGEIQLGLNRSGLLAMIRVGGPRATPTAEPAQRSPAVSIASLDQRFAREFPNAQLVSSGLKYRIGADRGQGILEPEQAYEYVPHVRLANGEVEVGRKMTVYYSVAAPDAKGIIDPQPDPNATGDAR